jgi:hypothetical protein
MKKLLPVLCLLLFTVKGFAQQFSQYNTGSLFDSFENVSQRAFIPDTSKQFASNFLLPTGNVNFYLSGNAQATLKTRAFLYRYDNSALTIGQGKNNLTNANANIYLLMFRMFTSLNGDVEMGFSWQGKAEGRGRFTDDAIAALNGSGSFESGTTYNNIFNSNYEYQTYHQISFTYREKINKQFAFGVKLSALLGIQYQNLAITNSSATYDKAQDTVGIHLGGTYYNSYVPGTFSNHDYLPTFRNPGASITLGSSYRTEDAFTLQANIKDLGFIHWSGRSRIYEFDGSAVVQGLSTPHREDSIYNKVYKIVRTNPIDGSFTTPTDGRAELSVNKSFWLDDDHMFKYSPTAAASKELFNPGFIGALVNPFQYQKYVLTVTTTYDDLKNFNLGLQLMMKTANFEFYMGSDKLTHTITLASDAINKGSSDISQNGAFTTGNFFLGFSMKFGPVVEHPMNASTIPTGEKGFFGRLWRRWFKTTD